MGYELHNLPQRLSEVRSLATLSQSELAGKLGVSPSLISHWEKGTRTPSGEQLLTLAQHLGVTLDYLLNATVRPQFKFRAQKTSPQLPAIEQALRDASMQVHFVNTAFNLAGRAPKPFSLRADFDSFDELPGITSHLRDTLKLNRRVTLDELKQALSDWNIFVFDWDMPWHLSGLSFRGPFSVIFINHQHTRTRRLFTLAHEFAHLVFHLDREETNAEKPEMKSRRDTVVSIATSRDPLEKEANAFAAELLMPAADLDKLVKTLGPRLREPAGLEAVAQHFNVSRDAIFYQLTKMGVFEWREKTQYFNGNFQPPTPPDFRVNPKERDNIDRQVDLRFRDIALGLHQEEKISTGKLAEWFFTARHIVDDYLAHLADPKDQAISEDPDQEGELAGAD